MAKELWYVSCSPRNPAKIRDELELLSQLEGKKWNAKNRAGKHTTQIQFAKMLSNHEGFEGSARGRETDFSARDRVAPMKTYGFIFIDDDDCVRLTKAGKALIKGDDEQHVFMMQMLKWQYPSGQHHGPKYEGTSGATSHKPVFWIRPFVFTLQVAKVLGGITKREIAMFLLPHRQMRGIQSVVKKIREYRGKRDKKKGRVARRTFDHQSHKSCFRECYHDYLKTCLTTNNRSKELEKKIRNSLDVADACIRLFRYTGIFATKGNKLVLNKTRSEEINFILSNKWEPVDYYNDADRFNKYFGDVEKPALPFRQAPFLRNKIRRLAKEIEELENSSDSTFLLPRIRANATSRELLKIVKQLTDRYRGLSRDSLTKYLRSPAGQCEVNEFYDTILDREVADPATFFEWNTWRAMIALDDAVEIVPFTKLDDSLQPIDCAKGNSPDMLARFGDYSVVVEVTLSSGRRQYFTETEPVTFHVGKQQIAERAIRATCKVYGLFIAPKINPDAANHFRLHIREQKVPGCGNVTVIPIDLETWRSILLFANGLGYLKRHQLGSLLAAIEAAAEGKRDVESWLRIIPPAVLKWKQSLTEERRKRK